MDYYIASRKAWPAAPEGPVPENVKISKLAPYSTVLRDGSTPVAFYDRKLKHFNPLRLFNCQTMNNFHVLRKNYAQHHLLRPKGLLSTAFVYGGVGWAAGVLFKQRYHKQFEYH